MMIFWLYFLSIILTIIAFSVLFFPLDRNVLIVCDDGEVVEVRIATSIISKAIGLSFKRKMKNGGLLFIFRDSSPKTFWNFAVRFPFDLFWIGDNGEVLERVLSVRPPQDFLDIKTWTSPKNCRFVLEVPVNSEKRDSFSKCAKIKINQIK